MERGGNFCSYIIFYAKQDYTVIVRHTYQMLNLMTGFLCFFIYDLSFYEEDPSLVHDEEIVEVMNLEAEELNLGQAERRDTS